MVKDDRSSQLRLKSPNTIIPSEQAGELTVERKQFIDCEDGYGGLYMFPMINHLFM